MSGATSSCPLMRERIAQRRCSVFVDVSIVGCVAVSVVDIVHVVLVRDADVPTPFTVLVGVASMLSVLTGLALIGVTVVDLVQVPVVGVVHVVCVRDRDVPATLTVGVGVGVMLGVRNAHVQTFR